MYMLNNSKMQSRVGVQCLLFAGETRHMTFSKLKKKFKGENRTGFQTQEDLVPKKVLQTSL